MSWSGLGVSKRKVGVLIGVRMPASVTAPAGAASRQPLLGSNPPLSLLGTARPQPRAGLGRRSPLHAPALARPAGGPVPRPVRCARPHQACFDGVEWGCRKKRTGWPGMATSEQAKTVHERLLSRPAVLVPANDRWRCGRYSLSSSLTGSRSRCCRVAPPIRRTFELGPRYLPRGRHAAEAPVVPCGEARSAAPVPIQFKWAAMTPWSNRSGRPS